MSEVGELTGKFEVKVKALLEVLMGSLSPRFLFSARNISFAAAKVIEPGRTLPRVLSARMRFASGQYR
jgi:hypothetical protein